jgi:glycosyltransferase involved in cell wall biosynthesis
VPADRTRTSDNAPPTILLHCAVDIGEAGGVQTVFRRLRAGLLERGWDVRQSWSRGADGPGTTVLLRVPVRRGSVYRTARSMAAALRSSLLVVRLLGRERPAVVNVHYAHEGASQFVALRHIFRYRLVISVHGSDVRQNRDGPGRARLVRQLRAADRIVAVSPELAEEVRCLPGIGSPDVRVVPNGIDYEFWSLAARTVSRQHRTIIHVGRLRPELKGQDLLLRALVDISDRMPGTRLVLVGDGPAEDDLRASAAELGLTDLVTFAGSVEPRALRDLLAGADILAMPSRSEGLPMALLEAMAAGLPVVVTDVGNMAEVVADGAGHIIPPDDADALRSALLSVLSDPSLAEDMGTRARQRARDYSAGAVDDAYDRMLRELLD